MSDPVNHPTKQMLPGRKDCRRCGKKRQVKFFGKHSSNRDGLRDWCRACEKKVAVERQPYFRRYRAEKRVKLAAIKGERGCSRCPERDPVCLQFHHTDPAKKLYAIGRLYGGTWSWETILREIEKCIVLCANCHLKLHGGEYAANRIG